MIMVKILTVLFMIDSLKRVKAQLEEVHEAHPLKSSALNIVNYILNKSPPFILLVLFLQLSSKNSVLRRKFLKTSRNMLGFMVNSHKIVMINGHFSIL